MKIPVFEPIIDKSDISSVMKALEEGNISGKAGRSISGFEEMVKKCCGTKYAVSASSGTAALHMAIAALGIKKGDEIIVPALTNIATANSAVYCGAKPVIIDVEPDTFNIDPGKIQAAISSKTKAVIAVHLYGHPADMEPIRGTAKKYGLRIVEDAAEAQGASYRHRAVGSIGDIGVFSFYANKVITSGEGGMLTTDNGELAHNAEQFKDLAYGRGQNKFKHFHIGYNYRMSNLLAALGIAQMKKLDDIIKRKRSIAELYNKRLRDMPDLICPVEREGCTNIYWMYGLLLRKNCRINRNTLMKKLYSMGIETRPFFYPLNRQPVLKQNRLARILPCPVAEDISSRGFYLPSSLNLTERQIDYICNSIKNILADG